jgi:hypothetical protein
MYNGKMPPSFICLGQPTYGGDTFMSEQNENENQLVVIGYIEETNDKQTKVKYEAVSGSRMCWIPRDAVVQQAKTSDGLTAFLVHSTDLTHGEYDPTKQFAGGKAPLITDAAHIDVASALESGVASANIKYLVKEQKQPTSKPDLSGGFGNNDEPDDDYDDTVPVVEGGFDVGDETWDGSLMSGGRENLIADDWRFTPVMKPLFTAHQDNPGDNPTFAPLANEKGEAVAFGVFNPTYATDQRPEGALLQTCGKDYYPLAYPVVYDPILDIATENGWKARVYAYNEGAKSRLDCDVSQAAQTLKDARQRLSDGGHKWLDLDLMNESAKSLDGLYRYGFTISNSLDGSKALSVQAIAERVYCTNLAIMGGVQTIATMKHTKSMKNRDWNVFASKIDDVITDAQRQLVEMEFMQHIPVDVQLFERLITLCETKGLIQWPSQKPIIKNDKVVGEKLTGGHMWRLALDGWTKPENDWVNVSADQEHTLYHAYNILNGAITHKPEWTDGKQLLKGRTVGIDTLNRRLGTVHDVMTGVLHQTVSDYRSDADVDRIGKNDLNDLAGYVDENGLTKLNDIPMASEVLNL